jgi:hypothetical protein
MRGGRKAPARLSTAIGSHQPDREQDYGRADKRDLRRPKRNFSQAPDPEFYFQGGRPSADSNSKTIAEHYGLHASIADAMAADIAAPAIKSLW